jgi:hypothetical protein
MESGRDRADALKALAPLALAYLATHRDDYHDLKDQLRRLAHRDPIDTLLFTVLGGGLAFYALEREQNPAIQSYWDAVLYVATSLSVGYDNSFPATQGGNALASAIHTFGPALAAAALDAPADEPVRDAQMLEVNKAILDKLGEIAKLLEAQR